MTELEMCKIHINDLKIKGLQEKKLFTLQQKFLRKSIAVNVDLNSSINSIKRTKSTLEKSIFLIYLKRPIFFRNHSL